MLSPVDRETFGRALRNARKAAEMTQDGLARAMTNTKAQSISMYERGEYLPPRSAVEEMEEILHVDGRQLLKLAGYFVDADDDVMTRLERLESQMSRVISLLDRLPGISPDVDKDAQ